MILLFSIFTIVAKLVIMFKFHFNSLSEKDREAYRILPSSSMPDFPIISNVLWSRADPGFGPTYSWFFKALHYNNFHFWRQKGWIRIINSSPVDLFLFIFATEEDSFCNDGRMYPNRVVFRVEESVIKKIHFPVRIPTEQWIEWKKKYAFCYELSLPVEADHQSTQIIHQDLNAFLQLKYGITGSQRVINMSCWCLEKTRKGKDFAGHQRKWDPTIEETKPPMSSMKNFIRYLNLKEYNKDSPVLDFTGYDGLLKFSYGGFKNMNQVNQLVEGFGLEFKRKEVPLKMIVIEKTDS